MAPEPWKERPWPAAVPLYVTPRNLDRRTIGPEVAEVSRNLGLEPLPWLVDCWDTLYELDDDGMLFFKEGRISVPRQSAKTTGSLCRHVHRITRSEALGWGRRPVAIFTAQSATAARDLMTQEWMPILEGSVYDPEAGVDLPVGVRRYYNSNGRESIQWTNGGAMRTIPPNATAGHGKTIDCADLDEAFAYVDARAEQALRPAMITRPSRQIVVQATAGTPDSAYLWGKVDDGRARVSSGDTGPVFFLEFACPTLELLHDERAWPTWMPALGYTIPLEAIRIEHDTLPEEEFARAYGNMWLGSARRAIPAAAWARAEDPNGRLAEGAPLYLVADASPGSDTTARRATVAVAGRRDDGDIHVEILRNDEGLGWVPDYLAAVTRKRNFIQLRIDRTGPIGSVLPQIEQTVNARVVLTDAPTMAAACTAFHEAVVGTTDDGLRVRHLGQPSLDAAVEGAAQRVLADSWAWSRRRATTDISPLVAVTQAAWDALTTPEGEYRLG